MADRKVKANKFTTDIDLCNNQIKNAAFEYWDNQVLPSDNLFDGRMVYLRRDITIQIPGEDPIVYEKGSVIVCIPDGEGGFIWAKLISSANNTDDDKIIDVEARIPINGWIDDGDFKSIVVPVEYVKEDTYPLVATYFDGLSVSELEELESAASHIVKATPLNGSIKFYADSVPENEIPIIVKVM